MKTKIFYLLLTLISVQLTLSAQTDQRINLAFQNEALPTVLKKLEQASSYRILFTYDDVQSYQVTATLHDSTIFHAIEKVLEGKPLTYTQKDNQYIIILSTKAKQKPLAIRGTVMNEKNEPMPFCNVLLLAPDSTFVNGCVTKEDGSFAMAGVEGTPYLLKTSYIGYVTSTQPVGSTNLIQLLPDTLALEEVTVTAERPLIEPSTNGLKANVIGTPLAKMGTASEMLSHLPFVTGKDGSYTVLGHGKPEIYINNRKVRDMSELDRLRADEIVSAEVITTPGAEYASNVSSVIRIKTIKQRGQGWSGSLASNYNQGHTARGYEQVKLNYRVGGLDIFGSGYVTRSTFYGNATSDDRLLASSIWEMHTQTHYDRKQDFFFGTLGFNYDFNERHSIGLRYAPNVLFEYENPVNADVTVKRDGEFIERIVTKQVNKIKPDWTHSLNGYYVGSIGEWQLDVNADYYFRPGELHQQITNNGEIAGESTSKERNYLYAIKAVASKPLGKGKLSFGTEETFTNRHDLFLQSGFSADANNHVKQSLWSAFANYSWAFGKWNLSAGFRYEHQQTDYYENNIHQKEQSPTYDDFIPALSANYRNGDWNLILSYKKNKDNPGYHLLSDAINYRSKYEYMTGNPLLPKQISNLLSLDASWKWIYLNAWYQHVKNSLTTVTQAYNDETHPGVTIIDYQAIPDSYSYGTAITLAPKFGIWQPQATINFSFWDSDLKAIGIDKDWNDPYWYFILDNTFTLAKGWFINVKGTYVPKFKQGSADKKAISTVDLRFSKSFLKDDALSVTLTAEDIFHTAHNAMPAYSIGTSTTFTEYYDHQRVGITLSYKFNATKSKYKGTGAGQSEKSRL